MTEERRRVLMERAGASEVTPPARSVLLSQPYPSAEQSARHSLLRSALDELTPDQRAAVLTMSAYERADEASRLLSAEISEDSGRRLERLLKQVFSRSSVLP